MVDLGEGLTCGGDWLTCWIGEQGGGATVGSSVREWGREQAEESDGFKKMRVRDNRERGV